MSEAPPTTETPASVKTTSHEEASRLPDPQWGWRRALIFLTVGSVMAMLSWVIFRRIERLADPALVIFVRYSFYTMWLGLTLYGVGATVTDVAKLVGAVMTTRRVTETVAPPAAGIITPEAQVVAPPAAPAPQPEEKPPWER